MSCECCRLVGVWCQMVKERVERLYSRSVFHWNTPPGALAILPEFSQHDSDFPFYWRYQRPLVTGFSTASHLATGSDTKDSLPSLWYTAVVYVSTPGLVTSSSAVYRLVKTLGRSSHLRKVRFNCFLFLFVLVVHNGTCTVLINGTVLTLRSTVCSQSSRRCETWLGSRLHYCVDGCY